MVGTSGDIDRIVFLAGAGIFAVITILLLKTVRRVMTTANKPDADEAGKPLDEISQWEKTAGALAVNVPSMIQEAITLHRLLVEDEVKLYGPDDERLADQATCDAAAEREIKAFRILARMPCMTPDEAQAKLAYFMEEPRPKWFSHMERLTWEAYIDDTDKGNGDSDQDKIFLRTLYVNGGLVDDG